MTSPLIDRLTEILGAKGVLTSAAATEQYRRGFRSGQGEALAVVFPHSLVEQWQVLEACTAADVIVLFQAANTGLTAASTPYEAYDRDVVIVSTLAIDQIHMLEDYNQVVALPGATLFSLEQMLRPLGRLPHSQLGSTGIGATIIGGICNNSGGASVKRGPAYTELALYAQRNADGSLELVNNLGIDLGDTPEEILSNLERGTFKEVHAPAGAASDQDYSTWVRDVEADTPARYNADPRRLYQASGCAGKLCVFAVRLDTFEAPKKSQVFYVGFNDTKDLSALRRALLTEVKDLPSLAEYMHAGIFDIAVTHGRDTFYMINWLGTDRLPAVFKLKGKVDALAKRLPLVPANLTDLVMQGLSRIMPNHVPKFMRQFRQKYEHHLILKVEDDGIAEVEAVLAKMLPPEAVRKCTDDEGKRALLHRFAAAGAAVRYATVNPRSVEEVLALDIALRRNDPDWFETLPDEITQHLHASLYYGHFLCHVFHQDYIVKKGVDPKALKAKMLAILDTRGAEYPAEHNVGHIYAAKPALAKFYQEIDPTNTFNPGIGKTSKLAHYGATTEARQAAE